MSEKDLSDLTVDDIVTTDDLSDLRETVEDLADQTGEGGESTDDGGDHGLPDDLVDTGEAAEIGKQSAMQTLDHLVHEDCDTPECEQARDGLADLVAERMGVDPEELGGAEAAEESEDAEGDEDDDPAEAADTADAGDHPPADDGDGEAEPSESEETTEQANAAFPDEL